MAGVSYRRQKPPLGPLKLDLGHPLAQSLVAAWVMNDFGSASALGAGINGPLTLNGGAAWLGTTEGPAVSFDGTNSYMEVVNQSVLNPPISMSLLVRLKVISSATGVYQTIASKGIGDSPSLFRFSANPQGGGLWRNEIRLNTTGGQFGGTIAASNTGVINQWGTSAFTFDGPSGLLKTYLDTALSGSLSTGATGLTTSSTEPFRLGTQAAGGDWLTGQIAYVYLFNRALAVNELGAIVAEPYAMFQTRPLRRWFVAAGGGAFDPSAVPWPTNVPADPGLVLVGF